MLFQWSRVSRLSQGFSLLCTQVSSVISNVTLLSNTGDTLPWALFDVYSVAFTLVCVRDLFSRSYIKPLLKVLWLISLKQVDVSCIVSRIAMHYFNKQDVLQECICLTIIFLINHSCPKNFIFYKCP